MAMLEIDNPFWRFSLRVYAAPGVAEECLEIQDRFGADINRLLFVTWIGATRGVLLDEPALQRIDEAVEVWSNSVVQPLRAVRRALKQSPDIGCADVQELRKWTADTELFAEQVEQAMLHRIADELGRGAAHEHAKAAQRNVETFLSAHDVPQSGVFPLPRLLFAVAAE